MKEQLIYKDRLGTDCIKWDELKEKFGQDDLLALWVADMDFEVPNAAKQALVKYAESGVFGYYKVPDAFYDAFIKWEKEQHGYDVKREWIRFTPGVVPALFWMVQCFTEEKDSVMISIPSYPPFFKCIEDNNREVIGVPLVHEAGTYTMDYEKIEQEIIEKQVKMYILCSPHNPVGRVWTREELVRLVEICKKHHVLLVADEIHQDIIVGDKTQIPAGSLREYTEGLISMTAASKTFNLAACQNAFILIEDEKLRNQFDTFIAKFHIENGNGFGYVAVRAAYEGGHEWLENVKEVIKDNYEYAKVFIQDRLPKATVSPLEGTYLMWVDLGAYLEGQDIVQVMQERCGLAIDYGDWFGGTPWQYYIRVNLATCKENIEKAMEALSKLSK